MPRTKIQEEMGEKKASLIAWHELTSCTTIGHAANNQHQHTMVQQEQGDPAG